MAGEGLLVTGRVLTGDWAGERVTDALWVEDGTVRAIGERARALGGGAASVDLGTGRCAVPGFWDAHIHLLQYGMSLDEVRLDGLDDGESVAAAVARALRDRPRAGLIVGHGWMTGRWTGDPPHRRFLDAVSDSVPIALWNHDHHSLWVNGAALQRAGIGPGSPDPPSGVVERDPDGTPTGVLRDAAAHLIERVWPEPSDDEAMDSVQRAQDALIPLGVTAVCAMGESPAGVRALCRMHREGSLRLRVSLYLPIERLGEVASTGMGVGMGGDRLWLGGLKGFMDGALGSQTAWMAEPFETGGTGLAMPLAARLPAAVAATRRAGLRLAIHAIGDRAVAEAIAALSEGAPASGLDRVEHAQMVAEATCAAWPADRVAASFQPVHLTDDLELMARHWGARSRWAFPLATLLGRGVPLLFGSDAPVSDPDPLRGIWAAVERRRPGGEAFHPEEAITAADALEAYAAAPAGVEGRPHLGRLTPGSPADMAVLSGDPLSPDTDLSGLRVVATWLGGLPA